jgi:Ca2+-binding RTX toxin-like protein
MALLEGTGRADTLRGGAGLDRITGGRGNDVLSGAEERDTFVFTAGGGADTVTDFQSGVDTLLLVGETAASVSMRVSGSSLVVSYNRGRDTITLQGVRELREGDIVYAAGATSGTSGGDVLDRGTSTLAQTLSGGLGDDRLVGGRAADWIEGGKGNDVLTGGAGRETFVLNLLDGDDTISDFQSEVDMILLRGIPSATVWVNPSRNDAGHAGLEINYGNQGDSIFLVGVSRLALGDIVFG